MKLKKDINISELLKDAQKCEHDVYLMTDDGDRLNLKSTLSQYVLVVLAGNRDVLRATELVCSPEDEEKLSYYTEE
ncbi:MAG: polya polymerase [Clostridiales bacterium]|nr:polya polymerase [Clostridiales bacterium]